MDRACAIPRSHPRAGSARRIVGRAPIRGAHQPADEIEEWRTRDPLPRLRRYLERRGLWDDTAERESRADAFARIDRAVEEAEAVPLPSFDSYLEAANAGADSVMVEAINRALQQALATDERVVVMGQDVGRLGGVFPGDRRTAGPALAHNGCLTRRSPSRPLWYRFWNGADWFASCDGKSSFMGFFYKCADQLIAQAGQIRARTWGKTTAPLVGAHGVWWRKFAPPSTTLTARRAVDGESRVKVAVPSTPLDAAGLLLSAIEDEDPVVIMEPIRLFAPPTSRCPNSFSRCRWARRDPTARDGRDAGGLGRSLCLQRWMPARMVFSDGIEVESSIRGPYRRWTGKR